MRNIYQRLPILAAMLLSFAYTSPVFSAESSPLPKSSPSPLLERSNFSIAAGLSNNSVSGLSDEVGFQFFGAYDLTQINLMDGVYSSVEFGFMDYGFDNDSTGIWGTYVVGGHLSSRFGWLARLGFDVGDDNGILLGVGGSFSINQKMETRIEYVIRDEVDSLQFNFLYRL